MALYSQTSVFNYMICSEHVLYVKKMQMQIFHLHLQTVIWVKEVFNGGFIKFF